MVDPLTLTVGAVAVASKAYPAVSNLIQKIQSSKSHQEIRDALDESVKMLSCLRKDHKDDVDRHTTKVPTESYKEWNRRVEKIEVHVKNLLAKYEGKNWIQRKLTWKTKMQNAGEEIKILLAWSNQIKDGLFVDPKVERVVKNNKAPKIKQFKTLQKPLLLLIDLLKTDGVNVIGIRGTLGIGKTTIMWNLNNDEEIAKMFDIVIWVKVSTEGSKKNVSREHLQQDIVRRLQIHEMKGNNNEGEVAESISKVLKGKKYLILLDDVKEKLEVSEMGIPDCSKGGKVVLTTRLHHVCSEMVVNRQIEVKYLSNDEPWMMFRNVLNKPELINHSTIGPLAWRVCKECSGLPLLIEKVANTFKLKHSKRAWIDGLNSWRKWPEKDCEGIWEMYKLLKFCYDELDDDRRQKCFLYSALYPEGGITIDNLLECWAAEEFLGNDHDATTEDIVMYGDLVLSHLEEVALIDKTENHVTMHKFMRQVALHIAEKHSERKYLVETSKTLQEPPDVTSWVDKNSISLGDNKLKQLPDSPNCKMLSTLFLQKNLPLKIIPTLFFKHMEELRVLDLSHTGIKSLLSHLPSGLKVLYLKNCKHLEQLPSNIKELETLEIQESGINDIQPYIEQLTSLKRLRVSLKCRNENANQEVDFNFETISELLALEELVIHVKSPDQWSDEVAEKIIEQVAELTEFKTLKVSFSNKVMDVIEVTPEILRIRVSKATLLPSIIQWRTWDGSSFQFFIGCKNFEGPQIPDFQTYVKYVKYCNGAGINFPIPEAINFPIPEADAFELINHKDVKQLSDFGNASMNRVRGCLIESCEKIETVLDTIDSAILPNLEHLYMKNLPMLKSIWKGTVQPDSPIASLTKLTTLVLTRCKMLVSIFSLGLIQQLHEIQHLEIEDCPEIAEIIPVSKTVDVLPNLKKLILHDMPNLKSICVIESLEFPLLRGPSLEELNIFKCPRLLKLPFNKDSAPELTLIKGEQHWWDKLQLQKEIEERFQKVYTPSS